MGWIAKLVYRFRKPHFPDKVSSDQLRQLEEHLGYRFQDQRWLVNALKHRSYVYAQQGEGLEANERLEFLGDAVLDLIVADSLFRRFSDKREGDLTQMKSLVVSRAILSEKAREIELGRFILLSREERNARGYEQPSILSDSFEALIGAVYLDGGIEPCRRFIERVVLKDLDELIRREDNINFKSKLLEHVQGLGYGHPKYIVHDEAGPDHRKTFSVEVSVAGEVMGAGKGRSKKDAQQMAAKDALQRLEAL